VNFGEALDRVGTVLAAGSWQWAVAGGVALSAYGNPRMTLDLDIVTEAAAQDTVVSGLEAAGYVTLYRSTGFSNHRHPESQWGRLDFIYVDGGTARQLFASLRPLPGPAGRSVLVPRAEHLIAMKVQAMKNAPDRALQDLADIAYLLSLPGTDGVEARGYFVKAGLSDRWEQLTHGR
jgi:hypothetical protein